MGIWFLGLSYVKMTTETTTFLWLEKKNTHKNNEHPGQGITESWETAQSSIEENMHVLGKGA